MAIFWGGEDKAEFDDTIFRLSSWFQAKTTLTTFPPAAILPTIRVFGQAYRWMSLDVAGVRSFILAFFIQKNLQASRSQKRQNIWEQDNTRMFVHDQRA
ncbi:MAG TPA: hypothetical protein DDX99_07620 [Desulfofustis sp.]|nr:hypothetical protein [Desulfofustis sp.]